MKNATRIFIFGLLCACAAPNASQTFDGARAMQHAVAQMNFGARHAGSAANRATGDYILAQLEQAKWKTETQEFSFRGIAIRNLIGKIAEGRGPIILLGAHYDTRPRAEQDRANPNAPTPGANDGASGVAVLLELARALDAAKLKNEIWLAFFDAEDNGGLDACALDPRAHCDQTTWGWSIGAEYLAEHLTMRPSAVIVVDMIGDADQNIYYEHNSDKELQSELWKIAARLGYTRHFIAEPKWAMEDDHTPFLRRGIRAVDMIDFDYPYWHTTQDTLDKISAASLERVGRVLQTWLENK